jgi:hypothetical protein
MCTFAIASGENLCCESGLRKGYEPRINNHARHKRADHCLFGLRIASPREVLMVRHGWVFVIVLLGGLALALLPHRKSGKKEEKHSNAKK